MSSIWTVAPESVTKELVYVRREVVPASEPDGQAEVKETRHPFSITIKKRLTVGEARRVQTAGWRGISGVGGQQATEISVDWKATTFARTAAYLLGWSLTDGKGRGLPIDEKGLETLHPDVYELIEEAIAAHVTEMEQEKKLTTGTPVPAATSA